MGPRAQNARGFLPFRIEEAGNNMKKAKGDLHIRIAKEQDAEQLLEIYAPYVEHTAITFEYEVPSVEEFRKRIAAILEKYPYYVAEKDKEILGYAYASPFYERAAYGWAAEMTIYLRQDQKRKGLGRTLYHTLETALKKQGVLNLYARIAEPEIEDEYLTKDSIRFHKRMGYHIAGKFYKCGYKFHHWYHLVCMEKVIDLHLKNQPKVRPFYEIKEH